MLDPSSTKTPFDRSSSFWKWMLIIFAVADFWGIWYVRQPTLSGPDPEYYKVLQVAEDTCGGNIQPTGVWTAYTKGAYRFSFAKGNCGNKTGNERVVLTDDTTLGKIMITEIAEPWPLDLQPFSIADWKIPSNEAQQIALDGGGTFYMLQHPGTYLRLLLLYKDGGVLVWKAIFDEGNGSGYDIYVNAKTGAILRRSSHGPPTA